MTAKLTATQTPEGTEVTLRPDSTGRDQRFVVSGPNEIRLAELERCAKHAEDTAKHYEVKREDSDFALGASVAALAIAAKIRSGK